MHQGLRRLRPEDPELAEVLALIREAFAYMDGRIDPPSSMLLLDEAAMRRLAAVAEVWAMGDPVLACMVLTPRPQELYLGKLAVAAPARGRGLARMMVDHAAGRAAALGLPAVALQTRIELVENQAAFEAMGFERIGVSRHPGHDRPTSVSFRRAAPRNAQP